MAALDLRLRVPSAELLTLPWLRPLAEWDATVAPLRDVPVGPSRHVVRFVEADGALWALKELSLRIAQREYDVLRQLESAAMHAVRPAGIVVQPFEDTAILLTRYLDGSWQYRRLLLRVPSTMRAHRARLFDAMAGLLVDLHRQGVFWGDCSLANTLFRRDGQRLQAWMVDAETSEVHAALSRGQRSRDLEISVENMAGGLLDVAARLGDPPEIMDQIVEETNGVRDRYRELWDLLHEESDVRLGDRHELETRLRRLHDLGFAVDEVRLAGSGAEKGTLRLQFSVAEREFHAEELRKLTGLHVGEGQATVLLNDLRAHQAALQEAGQPTQAGADTAGADTAGADTAGADRAAADDWLLHVFQPGMARAFEAVHRVGDPIQAYCDLLEVRWLLSERAGHDVGDGPALEALASRRVPAESAAQMAVAELATTEMPAIVVDPAAPPAP